MNPVLEHLPPGQEESFFAKAFDLPYFGTPWHYHPEFEIVLVVKSKGKRFIGNAISEFKDGDLSFLGPNLPHLYKNPDDYYQQNPAFRARSIIIHFSESSLGKDFLNLPQSHKLNRLFERSQHGLDIFGETKKKVVKKLTTLLNSDGLSRLIILLEILNILADTTEYKPISEGAIKGHNSLDADRLDKIFQYVMQNFQDEIRLENVAELICMTRTSFCRFFLERTKRTFSDFLIDFRLNHATKLLLETNKTIVDIGYECGYINLSNFNRRFKNKYKMSPKEFRKLHYK